MNPLASPKCTRRLFMTLAAMASILLTVGCSSNNGMGTPNGNGFGNSNFSGTYVFSLSGTDVTSTSESFFAMAGTITADGNGAIKGGTVDINDPDLGGVFPTQSVSPSTYTISPDGRGTGTIVTAEGTFGIDFVLTSNNHGLITRFDNNGTASGTLDLQSSASQSSLMSLAFSLSGVDGINSFGTVGGFTLDSSGTIKTGIQDFNDNNISISGLNGSALTGSVVLTSATSGTAQLNSAVGSLVFDVFVIDSTHLKLIETDTSGLALAGDAFTQQTSFTAGQLVFTLAGQDSTQSPLAVGGFVTTDANGTLTNLTEDFNDAGATGTVMNTNAGSCSAPAPFSSGRCQLSVTGFSNGNTGNFVFAAYPSSGGIQLLEIDSLGLLQGAAFAQNATSFPAGNYALNLSGANSDVAGDVGEVDDIAQFNATSTAAPATNMTGVLDENSILGGPVPLSSLSGSYTPDSPATGRGSISVTTPRTFIGGLSLEYYVVNDSTVLFIEGDSQQLSVGTFEAQSSASPAVAQARTAIMRPAIHPAIRPHALWQHK